MLPPWISCGSTSTPSAIASCCATQNVDGLHRRAGSTRMVELHGNLFLTRCTRCDRPPFPDDALYEGTMPMYPRCQADGATALLRPHIVWFGEQLDHRHLRRVERFLDEASAHRLA